MDGKHFEVKSRSYQSICSQCLKNKTSILGWEDRKKEHLSSSTYIPVVTFYNKAGQTKMKEEMDPDKKETGNFQAEFSDSWRLRLKR